MAFIVWKSVSEALTTDISSTVKPDMFSSKSMLSIKDAVCVPLGPDIMTVGATASITTIPLGPALGARLVLNRALPAAIFTLIEPSPLKLSRLIVAVL